MKQSSTCEAHCYKQIAVTHPIMKVSALVHKLRCLIQLTLYCTHPRSCLATGATMPINV